MSLVSDSQAKQAAIVFHVGCPNSLKLFLPAMRVLKEAGLEVAALVNAQSTWGDFMTEKCREQGFPCHLSWDPNAKRQHVLPPASPPPPTRAMRLRKALRAALHRLASLPVLAPLADLAALASDFSRTVRVTSRHKQLVEEFLDAWRPALLVMNVNIGINLQTAFVVESAARGIPVLGYSYIHGLIKEPLMAAVLAQTNGNGGLAKEMLFSRLVAALFPEWVGTYAGRRVLPFAPGVCLAAKWMGLMPDRPWSYLGGPLTRIAAYDDAMARVLVENNGLPAEKIRTTGNVAYDECKRLLDLARTDRARAFARIGIDPGKTMVLLSAVSYFTHKLSTRAEELAAHAEALDALAKIFDCTLVVSGRPASGALEADHRALCQARGAFFFSAHDTPIEHLLPLCDAFVTAPSTMLLLSGILDKPSIILNYGLWKKSAPDPDALRLYQGFPQVDSPEALSRLVPQFLTDSPPRRACAAKQRASLPGFGTHFDGKAGERFTALVQEMVAAPQGNG
jgi:hypothetical protein